MEEDGLGVIVAMWHRNDRDDWVHATVYWRVGLDRFGSAGSINLPGQDVKPNSYMVNPNQTVSIDPEELFQHGGLGQEDDEPDWRDV